MASEMTVEAVFEDGIFRPTEPVSLPSPQAVTLFVKVQEDKKAGLWPEDAAQIYREIAEEDRRLANAMFEEVKKTWPASEDLHE